jgi:hypothetical protein
VEKESAPKKQFRLKKKTFFIFLGVFIVLAFVAAGVTYFLLKDREERLEAESEYTRLLEYCGEGDGESLECKVLLGDFYDSDDGQKDCMEIVLPIADFDPSGRSLCFEKGVVDWENPYDDYSLYVPVLMTIEGYKDFNAITKIEMGLLEDGEAYELARAIYEEEGETVSMWTEEAKKGFERGYDLLGVANEEGVFNPSGVTLRKAKITTYEVEEGQIILNIEAFILGEERSFAIESETIPVSDYEKGEAVELDSQNIGELDMDLDYGIIFFLKNPDLFSVDFVAEQVSLLVDGLDSDLTFSNLRIINEE